MSGPKGPRVTRGNGAYPTAKSLFDHFTFAMTSTQLLRHRRKSVDDGTSTLVIRLKFDFSRSTLLLDTVAGMGFPTFVADHGCVSSPPNMMIHMALDWWRRSKDHMISKEKKCHVVEVRLLRFLARGVTPPKGSQDIPVITTVIHCTVACNSPATWILFVKRFEFMPEDFQ